MKYSHLMELSLTHPAKRKFCFSFFYHHQDLPCNASMVIPSTSNTLILTYTNLPHSFIYQLDETKSFFYVSGHAQQDIFIFPPSFYL